MKTRHVAIGAAITLLLGIAVNVISFEANPMSLQRKYQKA